MRGHHGWRERLAQPHGFAMLLGLQINPLIPNSILNLAAGLSRLDFRAYMASVVVGNLIPTAAYSYFASALLTAGNSGVKRELWYATAALALVVAAPTLAIRWRERRLVGRP